MDTIRQKISICICFIATSLLFLGCNPASRYTPTPTILPTPTPLPERMLPTVKIWEGVTTKTICLVTELALPENMTVIPDPIGETVRDILTNMGMQVVDYGASCDATLTLITQVEPLEGAYWGAGGCYTGGNMDMIISLTAVGQDTYETVLRAEKPPTKIVIVDSGEECDKLPEDFLDSPEFTILWSDPFLDTLVNLWGPQILVWSMDILHSSYPNPVSDKLNVIGPTDEVIWALIYAMQDESLSLSDYATYLIRGFAPEAEEAIPFLIQAAKDAVDKQDYPMIEMETLKRFGSLAIDAVPVLIEVLGSETIHPDAPIRAHDTLVAITGQDFGMETQKWQEWWEAEH